MVDTVGSLKGLVGIAIESEVSLPIFYRGEKIEGQGFRLDLVVEDKVVLELKSVNKLEPVHKKQLLTYLCVWQTSHLGCW